MKRIRREKKGYEGLFRISDKKMLHYKKDFTELYTKIITDKDLYEEERLRYNKILYIFPLQQLKL